MTAETCGDVWVDAEYEYECDLPEDHLGRHLDQVMEQEWDS